MKEIKNKDLTLIRIFDQFPNDDVARQHLESIRWPKGIVCPHCRTSNQSSFSTIAPNAEKKVRAGQRWCSACEKQFTVTIGTIFEDSHIPLRKWLIAWYLICSSKKGISSLALQRHLGIGSYRTALFMAHRIRHALQDPVFSEKFFGTIEVDETYVGGARPGKRGRGAAGKTPVVAVLERGGRVRSQTMKHVTGANLKAAIRRNVAARSKVHTDEHSGYRGLGPDYSHHAVKHSADEYVRQEKTRVVTTNSVESFFAILKRGIVGTFHHVSQERLPLYLAEFDHRHNYRKVSDGERTIAGLKKMEGKRLVYH
jgi:transposase-like protein